MVAFPAADDGSEDRYGALLEELADAVLDGGERLLFDRDLAVGAVAGAELGVEEADEIPQLGDGGDGRLHAALGDALLDRDGRRQAGEGIELGLFELLGELARVGGHRVEEAALAFGEEDVEGEGGLAGAAEAGDDDELVARDVEGDVLEVVFAGAAELD